MYSFKIPVPVSRTVFNLNLSPMCSLVHLSGRLGLRSWSKLSRYFEKNFLSELVFPLKKTSYLKIFGTLRNITFASVKISVSSIRPQPSKTSSRKISNAHRDWHVNFDLLRIPIFIGLPRPRLEVRSSWRRRVCRRWPRGSGRRARGRPPGGASRGSGPGLRTPRRPPWWRGPRLLPRATRPISPLRCTSPAGKMTVWVIFCKFYTCNGGDSVVN